MHEMEGPQPGFAALTGELFSRRAFAQPVAGARNPRKAPAVPVPFALPRCPLRRDPRFQR
jgi:hypothetical protein